MCSLECMSVQIALAETSVAPTDRTSVTGHPYRPMVGISLRRGDTQDRFTEGERVLDAQPHVAIEVWAALIRGLRRRGGNSFFIGAPEIR